MATVSGGWGYEVASNTCHWFPDCGIVTACGRRLPIAAMTLAAETGIGSPHDCVQCTESAFPTRKGSLMTVARPEIGQPVPFTALAYVGQPCMELCPGTALACCLADGHTEDFHIAYDVGLGRMIVSAVWPPYPDAPPLEVQASEAAPWSPAPTPPADAVTKKPRCGAELKGTKCGLLPDHTGMHAGVDLLGTARHWNGSDA